MNSGIRFLLIAILLIFNLSKIAAQNKADIAPLQDSIEKKSSYFVVNSNYLSNAVYSGRKDSLVVPYVRASLGYYHKSGLYADMGASLLVSPEDTKRIDLVTFTAGYAVKLTAKLDMDINATKMYYTDLSYAVESELKGMAGINLGYDAGIVSISGGAELLFSTNTDIFSNLKISRYFQIGSDLNNLSIAPSIQVNAGTQYYNQAYYSNRKYSVAASNGTTTTRKGHAKKNAATSGGTGSTSTTSTIKSLTFTNKNQLTILDYELSLPLNYQYKNFSLFAIPTFAIPVNASSYEVDGALTKEKISNTFFMEIGISIKFPTHRK